MRVIGIDPGSVVCGYGVVDYIDNQFYLVNYGVIHAKKIEPEINHRIKEIYLRVESVIARDEPIFSAFESTFYSKNAQSLIKLSHARAAALLAASMKELPIFEYSPREVKKSVTGNGNASKQQVQYMIMKMLNIKETNELYDATDALAVAVTHCLKYNSPVAGKSSWKDFLKNNPGRIVNS